MSVEDRTQGGYVAHSPQMDQVGAMQAPAESEQERESWQANSRIYYSNDKGSLDEKTDKVPSQRSRSIIKL